MVFPELLLNKTNFAQEIHGQNMPFKKKIQFLNFILLDLTASGIFLRHNYIALS